MKPGIFSSVLILTLTSGLNSYALEGIKDLETKLIEKNPALQALKLQIESNSAQLTSAKSSFYPTLNAVAGREYEKTDDLDSDEKGQVAYLEGGLNLFRGFKDVAVKNIRETELKTAELESELQKRELRLRLFEAISQMAYVHKVQKILEEEFKVTQTQKQMAARKVAAGLTSQVDNLEFDLRENEIQIELKQIEQLHNEAHESLNQMFGEEITDNDIKDVDFSSFDTLSQVAIQAKAEETIDYKIAELNRLKANYEKSEIKSEFMPSLDFSYSYGRITPTENTSPQFNETKYSLLLTIPLFSGFDTYYKTKSANFLSQAAERRKDQIRLNATAEINRIKTKVSELSALFQLNEKKLVTAQKYFDITLNEYKRGVKNSPDLVGATERLYSSKKRKFDLLKELESLSTKALNLKI